VSRDLERELEAIGRRVSPRLDHARSAVTRAAEQVPEERRLWPWSMRPLRPRPMAGAVASLAAGAVIAAAVMLGPLVRPATPAPAPPTSGAPVAMASDLGQPTTVAGTGPAGAAGSASPLGEPSPPSPAATPAVGPDPGMTGPPPASAASAPSAAPGAAGGGPDQAAPIVTASPPPTEAPPTPAASPPGGPTPTPATWSQRGPAAEVPSPTPTPAPTRITLTEADRGTTIHVRRGQQIEVDLSAGPGAWTEPAVRQSSAAGVLRLGSGGTRSDGSAHALFTAASDGSATVHADRAPAACATSAAPCPAAAAQPFDVTVVVTG
jgi:hypothetical protein